MQATIKINGNTATGAAAQARFTNWLLSLEAEGKAEEAKRNALASVRIFEGARSGNADDRLLCALAGVTFE